ncbi:hypothetical protein KKF59_00250 [Patescibacteria group bacterium]|nr:hypothetical protein [Patescibacteria group bacterium]MBU1034223.1 hypothetical protein [Patescibacteria group bacterium]MBU1629533.1 hypothetical protein [Patescibacteria group bacterium]MBU1907549.1 hypothetical protein [Patescibacteria group bacterium]
MIRTSHQGPVYREVLASAINAAWHERRYWILSLLAGILVTAGTYDVLWNAITNITLQGRSFTLSTGALVVESVVRNSEAGFSRLLTVIGGVEVLLFLTLLTLFIACLSCIAQGALVYALGAHKRGAAPKLKDAFHVGAGALWPVIILNIMALSLIWILRFLASLPLFLAIKTTTAATYATFIFSFVVFVPLIFIVAILQIFALNSMILQGSTLSKAIERSYQILKKHWLIVVETAVLQVLLSIGVWLFFIVAIAFALIPLFVIVMASAALQSITLFTLGLIVASVIFISGAVCAAAFTIQLQYATWTYMYRRLGEGGVIPKIHRVVRNLTGFFGVPQA